MSEIAFGIAFFALILASVALHEVGHLIPAKIFGVRAPQFFVGFGRRIWSTRRGETEYGLKWIPLGGYVRLLGMYPPGVPRTGPASRLDDMADAARAVEWEQITPEDVAGERLLYQKRTWQKLVVMAGGPGMNLLIAFLIFWAINGLYGSYRPQPEVASVQACVVSAEATSATCTELDPKSPAALAGLRAGDVIVAFNGVEVADWPQLTRLIRLNMDEQARITVVRNGVRQDLPVVNTVVRPVPDLVDPTAVVEAGWLGMRPSVVLVKGGPEAALADMWTLSVQSLAALVKFPVMVYDVVADLVTGQPRDANGPISIFGASRAAGEIATTDQFDPAQKVVLFGSLLASLNLFLALFNLVPLPPLDGGHIAGAVYEWARRQVARLRGRPDPGPFDTARLLPVAYAVAGFLILAGVALILADILSPIQLF